MAAKDWLWFCCVLIATITVTIAQQASLEIQPNQKVIDKEVGQGLALTCRPNAPDPSQVTQLEWRDPRNNRIDTSNRLNPFYVQKLSGEPGAVLIFSHLTENQAGNYTCTAFYSNVERLTASVQVNTFVDISFVDAPENQYPVAGKDFPVKCKVKGNPSPIVDWDKEDQPITTNEKFIVGTDELLIKNVSEIDDGVYKCTAVVPSTGKIKTKNIRVEVQVPPAMLPMEDITIIEGETASAKCSATGKPPPTYKWIKLRERQDLSQTDRFRVNEQNGEVIMTRIEYNDDGEYKCVAKNDVGYVEQVVKINVLVKPKIYELINITAPVGGQAEIICKASGRPAPKIMFRKYSNTEPFRVGPQLTDSRITYEEQHIFEKGETFGTLVFTNLNRSDDGLYECRAENRAGDAYKTGHIAIEFPPTFERTQNLPPVWSWEGHPGNLTCIPEAIPNATIVWKVGGRELLNSVNFQIQGNGPTSSLIIQPYNEERLYTKYECLATNKLGQASLFLSLKRGYPPRPLSQVRAESITATTIKFSIVPANNFDGLPIRAYIVKYKSQRVLPWEAAFNHTWSFGAPYILENLLPEETYDFQFAARNDVGMGGFINVESITMPRRSVPAEPKFLLEGHAVRDENSSDREDRVVFSPYADHFELRWSVPNDNGDPIQHYLIRYCQVEKISGEWRDTECSSELQQSFEYNSYQLDQLAPDTTYKIELRAHNAIGDSTPAQVRVRTARGMDPPVSIVTKSGLSSSAIIIIVIGVILLVLILLDITCFYVNRLGVIAICCNSRSKKTDEEDPKLGREEREPLKPEEKSVTLEFDGSRVYSKSGEIIGKHSAV